MAAKDSQGNLEELDGGLKTKTRKMTEKGAEYALGQREKKFGKLRRSIGVAERCVMEGIGKKISAVETNNLVEDLREDFKAFEELCGDLYDIVDSNRQVEIEKIRVEISNSVAETCRQGIRYSSTWKENDAESQATKRTRYSGHSKSKTRSSSSMGILRMKMVQMELEMEDCIIEKEAEDMKEEREKQWLEWEETQRMKKLEMEQQQRRLERDKTAKKAAKKLQIYRKYVNEQELGSDDPDEDCKMEVDETVQCQEDVQPEEGKDESGGEEQQKKTDFSQCEDSKAKPRDTDTENHPPGQEKNCGKARVEPSEKPPLNSETTESPKDSNFMTLMSEMTKAIKSQSQQQCLQANSTALISRHPPTFSGVDVLDYPLWNQAMIALVWTKFPDAVDRLYYIGEYTSGQAKEAIKPLMGLQTEDACYRAMEILDRRYGDPFLIATERKKRLEKWPEISFGDSDALQKFSDFIFTCETAMEENGYLDVLNAPEMNQKLTNKLPRNLKDKWSTEAFNFRERSGQFPPFSTFCHFVRVKTAQATDPVLGWKATKPSYDNRYGKPAYGGRGGRPEQRTDYKRPFKALATYGGSSRQPDNGGDVGDSRPTCPCCKYKGHKLDSCYKFLKLPVEEREKCVSENRLCYGCLNRTSRTHYSKICEHRMTCKNCGKGHPTSLCRRTNERTEIPDKPTEKPATNNSDREKEKKPPDSDSKTPSNSNSDPPQPATVKSSACSREDRQKVIMSCVPVIVSSEKTGRSQVVYCFLDSLSNGSFICESVRHYLEGEGDEPESISVVTMHGEGSINSRPCSGITVTNLDKSASIKLPKIYSKTSLPVNGEDIVTHKILDSWSHLRDLKCEIPEYDPRIPVGIIIGANVPRALEPQKFIKGVNNSPFAVETVLGWTVSGPCDVSNGANPFKANFAGLRLHETSGNAVIVESKSERDSELSTMILDLFAQDFTESQSNSAEMSVEEQRFMEIMEKGAKLKDGHYELPLPLRHPDKPLPNNRDQVYRLAMSVKNRLLKNPKMKEDYTKFMETIIDKNFAEKVDSTVEPPGGKCWYLPHHATYHPTKKKIRVVFNASKEYEGQCLNDELITGPTQALTNSLAGILMRFRTGNYAFTGDVEKMFYQVGVPPEQRDLLRFFWWDDWSGEPTEYRMCVHLFGATSSPACASYALKLSARSNAIKFSDAAVKSVTNDMYVDDLVKSMDSLQDAQCQITEVVEMCKLGGFNLTKFSANSEALLENLDSSHREPQLTDAMVLGMKWNQIEDLLYFRELPVESKITRRTMLGFLHAVYDPLGVISPFLLTGKLILQNVTALIDPPLSWDDPVREAEAQAWLAWKNDLAPMENLKLERCYKPKDFGVPKTAELHVFADASSVGYGCAIYLKLVNQQDDIAVALVQGKSRVIPAKGETIPRAELVAATMASVLGKATKLQLISVYPDIRTTFYTDSTVVLGYIRNETKRFKTFVSNRVRKIRNNSETSDWRHCKSEENPADFASRGLKASDTTNDHAWFKGPTFLWDNDESVAVENSQEGEKFEVDDNDPELKRSQKIVATGVKLDKTSDDPVLKMISNQSEWSKMVKRIGSVIALVEKSKEVKVEHLDKAKMKILTRVQKLIFQDEYERLSTGQCVTGQLASLNPFLHTDGLIRVGGRIDAANVEWSQKHPIILPKFGKLTDAIIMDAHERAKHGGRTSTMNELRTRGYWIICLNSRVKRLIHKCVRCRRLRGKFSQQRMADLPKDRLDYEAPPMTYCGVDVFGHFIVKNGRKEQKRYCALFTDLVYRGIHIEVLDSLETDSFLCALRRFVARRGQLRLLRSDNGSNFHGANNELRKSLADMEPAVRKFLLDNGGDLEWKYNVPLGSHHGGVWERKIGAARRVIESTLGSHAGLLNDQGFNTLMAEVEAIVNCQPLTVESLNDPNGPIPLCPMNILTQKSKVILPPPGSFDDSADLYSRKQWRKVQYLANVIWSRYRSEYMNTFQSRLKWNKDRRNLRVGDVVIMLEDSMHRNHWPMGIVTDIYPDKFDRVRSVKIRVAREDLSRPMRFFDRPISKLVVLLENNVDNENEDKASSNA